MITTRVPDYIGIGTRVRASLKSAAEDMASEDIDNRVAMMRKGLAPDGDPQKPGQVGRTPLVRTGKLASRGGWEIFKQGDTIAVRPVQDRREPVRRLEIAGYRIVLVSLQTKISARQRLVDIARGRR